jgi:hypothetical protein
MKKVVLYFSIFFVFRKIFAVNNYAISENLPNLVTLVFSVTHHCVMKFSPMVKTSDDEFCSPFDESVPAGNLPVKLGTTVSCCFRGFLALLKS